MKIVSVNVSTPVSIEFNNETFLTGIYKYPRDGVADITLLGIAGDSIIDRNVHGGLDQAVYLYHQEDYEWWSAQLGKELAFGTFGENLTLAGLDDIAWVVGDRLYINEVELEITAPRTPCFKLAVRMGDTGFVKKFAAACRPGAYARVIREGAVKTGDGVEIKKTTQNFAAVKEVFTEWHSKNKSLSILKKAIDSPLAEVHRGVIQGWYNEQVFRQP